MNRDELSRAMLAIGVLVLAAVLIMLGCGVQL